MDRHIPLRSLPIESLEERRCLAVCFAAATHDVDVADVANISATYLNDFDGDGDTDIVFRAESSVGWYENTNGLGHFAEPLRLQSHGETPRFIADVDGDGDSDLITWASSPANVGAWFENVSGRDFSNVSQPLPINPIEVGDIDGDKDLDLVGRPSLTEHVGWFERRGDTWLAAPHDFPPGSLLDVDGDQDLDVVDLTRGWYESVDGVFQGLAEINATRFADVDLDGDLDAISRSDGKFFWRRNLDGRTFEEEPLLIAEAALRANDDFEIGDVDSDGDGDLVIMGENSVMWFENTGNVDGFAPRGPILTFPRFARTSELHFANLDGDGSVDILVVQENDDVRWFEMENGQLAETIISQTLHDIKTTVTADIDGDGDSDILAASLRDEKVVWYENRDGLGQFGPQRVISVLANAVRAAAVADLDGDGDQDVIVVRTNESVVEWFENVDGLGNYHLKMSIDAKGGGRSISAEDLDADGDLDVVAGAEWFENTDGKGNLVHGTQFTKSRGFYNSISVDIDNDGDLDIVRSDIYRGEVGWFENLDGGKFSGIELIEGNPNRTIELSYSFDVGDLDSDGDYDIVSAVIRRRDQNGGGGAVIYWYENLDGLGTFGDAMPLEVYEPLGSFDGAIIVADLDDDSDVDIMAGTYVFQNLGQGVFAGGENVSDIHAGRTTGDIDGDGDLDVVSGRYEGMQWHEQIACRQRNSLILHAADAGLKTSAVSISDIDGDGIDDTLAIVRYTGAVWFQNTGSEIGPLNVISADATNVVSGDLDTDGRPDILIASGSELSWLRNLGRGKFSEKQSISIGFELSSLIPLDAEGDGDLDVFALDSDGQLVWFRNGGRGEFSPNGGVTIATHVRALAAADLNGNGLPEFLTGREQEIESFEFLLESGEFHSVTTVDRSLDWTVRRITTGDLDSDGDDDIVVDSDFWYENIDGETFGHATRLTGKRRFNFELSYADILSVDLDGDDDLDLVGSTGTGMGWMENRDGNGGFTFPSQLGPSIGRISVASDLDNDGDVDFLLSDLSWLENRPTGDVNGDGVFDTTDIVAAFQAGKYGSSEAAAFEEGDWNADGRFDFADLEYAFSGGHFQDHLHEADELVD